MQQRKIYTGREAYHDQKAIFLIRFHAICCKLMDVSGCLGMGAVKAVNGIEVDIPALLNQLEAPTASKVASANTRYEAK